MVMINRQAVTFGGEGESSERTGSGSAFYRVCGDLEPEPEPEPDLFRPSSIAVRHSYTGVRLPPYRPQGGGGGASAELGSSAPVPGSIALWSDIVR